MRMQSIKSQHEELATRSKAMKDSNIQQSNSSITQSVGKSTSPGKSKIPAKKHTTINKAVAEKGWISFSTKMSTQNFHISRMQSHHQAITNVSVDYRCYGLTLSHGDL